MVKNLSICVVTNKSQNLVQKQLNDIKNSVNPSIEIFASCRDGSAAHNRNYSLDKEKGDIIILIDDDITGFYPGWEQELIKPLLVDKSISIVSARLIKQDGTPGGMMYDNHNYDAGYFPPKENVVPTACVAMRKTSLRFDEKYLGCGFEDTDFCKLMELIYSEKRVVINNDCKLIHLGNNKHNSDIWRKNKEYYLSKWGSVKHPKKNYLTTIIYYTSNTEDRRFENFIIRGIEKVAGELPIISVSQKPIQFGNNICVGDRGHSYLNAFRQLLIGCEAATTPFVAMAESDFLYPKGYFDFRPKDLDTIYTYDNVWVLWARYQKFFKKEQTHGTIFYGRENLIKILKEALKDCPQWSREKIEFELFKPEYKQELFTGNPVVNIKTENAPNKGMWLEKGCLKSESIDYWGKSKALMEALCMI